ncbi:MAG TPA: hypothetical protein VHE78_04090 [Gemmatimonadaceae bacterium]|nr:hypothetical protein [Gemmatimonadaceae bacterium]
MRSPIQGIARVIAARREALSAHRKLIGDSDSYLYSSGWMASLERGYPCKSDGTEVPWMNYCVVSFLEQRLKSDFHLFEYGSGFSTLFFSRLVASVKSVEHDQQWFERVSARLPGNVELVLCAEDDDGDYCRTIHRSGRHYDVVIVDGRDRVNCMKQSLSRLTSRGVLLLDDSQRTEYAPGIALARSEGYLTLDFEGLKPISCEVGRTTVMYRRDNCFNI